MHSARGFEYGVVHIISPDSGPVATIVSNELQISVSEVEFLLDLGSIYHNHQRIKENISVSNGDYLRVHTKPRRFLANTWDWRKRVVFDHQNFVVVNKPSGLPVHASVDNIRENLISYLSESLQCELYVTHRLDVPTNGLIVFAKTLEFQREFNKLLIAREVQKIYRAVVTGAGPEIGKLIHYMEPSPRAPKKVFADPGPSLQECVLEVLSKQDKSVFHSYECTELLIQLHTGRTHQIRTQLSFTGFPILGDTAYGAKKHFEGDEIALTACELKFTDATGNFYSFEI